MESRHQVSQLFLWVNIQFQNPVGPDLDRTGWAPVLPIHDVVFQLPNTVLGQVEVKGRGHGLDGDADWWVSWEILLIDSITS